MELLSLVPKGVLDPPGSDLTQPAGPGPATQPLGFAQPVGGAWKPSQAKPPVRHSPGVCGPQLVGAECS